MLGSAWLWLALAGVNGFLAVAAGAFGAHGASDLHVKSLLQTGAQYQAIHAAAALACYGALRGLPGPASLAGWLFGLGALVFGGSLYALALSGIRVFGAITPIGGVLMLAGWAVVIWGAVVGALAASQA